MADPITEDDDIEVVEVEALPKPGETPPAAAAAETSEDDAEDGADEEDARLVADDEDDDEADATDKDSPAHKKRVKRRQIQKQARDRTLAALTASQARIADLEKQVSEIRGTQVAQSEGQVDERLVKTREDINIADRIMAKALEAGNGEDFVAAQNMRDAAKAVEFDLLRTKGSFTEAKTSAPDPVVITLSNEWKTANASWYGVDAAATDVANRVDGSVKRDGYDPKTPAYWQELSRRLQAHFEPAERAAAPPKKKVPPQGQTREHVPNSTRREVYVTPERKQAMVDAGIWDDPQRRTKMLKAYADFDRDQSA